MHLFEGLGHLLQRVGGGGEQHLAVAQGPAEHAPLVVRAEGPGEQPVSVQALEPLTVEPSGLRATGGALGLTGVDQQDLQASRFQELKEGHPVDAGRFHRDGGDPAVKEPVSQGSNCKFGLQGFAVAKRHRYG